MGCRTDGSADHWDPCEQALAAGPSRPRGLKRCPGGFRSTHSWPRSSQEEATIFQRKRKQKESTWSLSEKLSCAFTLTWQRRHCKATLPPVSKQARAPWWHSWRSPSTSHRCPHISARAPLRAPECLVPGAGTQAALDGRHPLVFWGTGGATVEWNEVTRLWLCTVSNAEATLAAVTDAS